MAITIEAIYDHTIYEIMRSRMFTQPTSGRWNDWMPVLMDAAAGFPVPGSIQ